MIRRALLSSLLFVAACKSGPSNVVDLTIVVDASVPQSVLASLRTLTIAVTGVNSKTTPYKLPATGLPKQETVQLLPSVSSGTLTVTVTGSDGKNIARVQGSKMVTLTGKEVALSITLTATTPPMVTVTPPTATVTVGKQTPFTANRPVTWSVMGGDANGTIDAKGVYTGSPTPGMYTVVATDAVDSTVTASATVSVVDYGVTLLIGALGGSGELDGMGSAARFNYPQAMVDDGNGHLSIGDQSGCTLRQLDLASANVTTLGGNGLVCQTVDGKLGSTALFSPISAMAYDAANNVLYVQEGVLPTAGLRKVVLSTGQVTTIRTAGGGTSVGGFGLAFDDVTTAGHPYLYISKRGGDIIQRWDVSTTPAIATLWAGQPQTPGAGDTTGPATMAQFNHPTGLAFDGANHYLYVADQGNNEIRRIVTTTGATSTIAGAVGVGSDADGTGGAARFNGPFGLALRDSNSLFVTEQVGSIVRLIALSNGSVSRFAGIPYTPPASGPPPTPQLPADGGNSMAQFGPLGGATFDTNSNTLYVADGTNNIIRSVTPFNVQTVAGTDAKLGSQEGAGAAARFFNIGTCLTVGSAVYFTDNGNATVRKYDLATDMLSTVAGTAGMFGDVDANGTAARFERPEGLFEDGGILYITDGSDSTIRAMDLATGAVTTIAGTHLTQGFSDGTGTSAQFGYPWYVTGDHAGHLYISDALAPIMRKLDLDTRVVKTVAGNMSNGGIVDGMGTAASFVSPYGLAVEAGVVYIADGSALRSMTRDSFTVITVAGGAVPPSAPVDGFGTSARVVGLSAIAGDGLGHIYFGDVATLRRYDVTTTKVTTIIGHPYQETDQPGTLAAALVGNVSGITFTPSGDIIYEDSGQSVAMLLRMPPAP